MSYTDRLRPCRYVSPSGKTFDLNCDDLERTGTKKASVHELVGQSGVIVQDLGQNARRYPLKVYISGTDYDQTADALAEALEETGRATVQHPRWGDLEGYPLTYTQKENLVDGALIAEFEIDFIHAPAISPVVATGANPAALLSAASLAADANATADILAGTASDLATITKTVTDQAKAWNKKLQSITAASESLKSEINAAAKRIERNVTTLVASPIDLCESLTSLARLPAQLEESAVVKAITYTSLLSDAIAGLVHATVGQAALSSVSLLAIHIASMESAASGTYRSRDDALSVASTIATESTSIRAALETLDEAGYNTDPDLLAQVADMEANLRAYLLDASFSLRIEHRVTLDRDRNALELIRELKGEVSDIDAALDDFFADNPHLGDVYLVIPRGSEVRYYVD